MTQSASKYGCGHLEMQMRSRFGHCKPRAMFKFTECAAQFHSKTGTCSFAPFWRTLVRRASSFGADMHTLGFPEAFMNLAGIVDQGRANAFNGMRGGVEDISARQFSVFLFQQFTSENTKALGINAVDDALNA